jgi:hypothetical protein
VPEVVHGRTTPTASLAPVLRTVWRTWGFVTIGTLVGGALFASGLLPGLLPGLLCGVLVAGTLLGIACLAARVLERTHQFVPVMAVLLLAQGAVWLGLAVAIVVGKLSALGIVLGFSTMPTAVVLAVLWSVLRRQRDI